MVVIQNHSLPQSKKGQIDKPGSVEGHHLSRGAVSRALVQPTRRVAGAERPAGEQPACCLALLRTRFTVPPPLPEERWALTPPFHPVPPRRERRVARHSVQFTAQARSQAFPRNALGRSVFCGTLCRRTNPAARALPGVLLYGARTFLPARCIRTRSGGDLICPSILSAENQQ